ncbi:unnamed protein product [Ectocarpus sp. CCAP 1310/34]|nr:unnamed protein product [Ectocarpus sp. CCAP 1310/34]
MAVLSASASLARWRFADASASCMCHFLMNHTAPSSTLLYHTSGSLALSFHLPPFLFVSHVEGHEVLS